jgi:signal transduction histidine kinase
MYGPRPSAWASSPGRKRARAEAEGAGRLKAEFLATMSHEFRTPLNAILGYAQLLTMGVLGPATPAQHAHLERLQSSARHLLGLVDDVLDVAKVDADRLRVRRDPLRTGAAVAAAVTLVQPQGTAKGVRLTDLGAGEAGVPYVGDEHRVRQVLVNLLANAVKFTPAGGQVTVASGAAAEPDPGAWRPGGAAAAPDPSETPASAASAEPAAAAESGAPGAWAFVRVTDTGPGLAPDLLPRLFEPFVQGDGALTRERGGTGLGLAISRRLARLMGGDLTVHSRPGHGATFTLWIPGRPGGEPPGGRAAAPGDAAAGTPAPDALRTPDAGPGDLRPGDAGARECGRGRRQRGAAERAGVRRAVRPRRAARVRRGGGVGALRGGTPRGRRLSGCSGAAGGAAPRPRRARRGPAGHAPHDHR